MPAPGPGSGTSRWASASGERAATGDGRTPADVLALAERVLGFAEAESPTEVEVMAMADDGSLTRFANSEIHQNVAESNVQVNLRFVVGKRVGVASTNRSDDEGLRRLAERAAAIARNSEELEDWGGLPEPDADPRSCPRATPPATADATPELRAEGVRAVIAAADAAGVVLVRLVLDRDRDARHRELEGRPGRRSGGPCRSC